MRKVAIGAYIILFFGLMLGTAYGLLAGKNGWWCYGNGTCDVPNRCLPSSGRVDDPNNKSSRMCMWSVSIELKPIHTTESK